MFTKSLWNATADITDYPSLSGTVTADVAIIGAGATGLSLAAELSERGLSVVLLEALKVGGGTTAHSTGNLYYTLDKHFAQISSKYDAATLRTLLAARAAALDRTLGYIHRFNIDCDLVRCNWYKYTNNPEMDRTFDEELRLGTENSAGISGGESAAIPLPARKVLVVKDQAQYNPMRYAQGMAAAVVKAGVRLFENTRVTKVEKADGTHTLHTEGGVAKARFVVHATHSPKGIRFVHTLLGPYREYGIACRLSEPVAKGIFWAYLSENEKLSYRMYERGGQRFLILVGKPHKVGQEEDTASRIRMLETFARENFNIEEVSYRWGGQHYRPADHLPYIGKESGDDTSFIATGYSTDGLVFGTLAGMLIADLISGNDNPYADLFDPARRQPLKSAQNFLKENLNVAAQLRRNLPGVADADNMDEVKPGQGCVLDRKGKKIAAYRDESGKLMLRSALCTHMGCVVAWNNAEKTWDCPCHGSRFQRDGTVLEGPAYDPLDPLT